MRERVYDYLCYTVLLQLLPVGRPVIQSHDSRNAPLPQPEKRPLVRDDKLQGHRPSAGPAHHHRVEIDVDGTLDVGVREREVRSAIHNKAAPALLPDHPPQAPAVDAGHFHCVAVVTYCPKKREEENGADQLPTADTDSEEPARVCAFMSSEGIPAHQF